MYSTSLSTDEGGRGRGRPEALYPVSSVVWKSVDRPTSPTSHSKHLGSQEAGLRLSCHEFEGDPRRGAPSIHSSLPVSQDNAPEALSDSEGREVRILGSRVPALLRLPVTHSPRPRRAGCRLGETLTVRRRYEGRPDGSRTLQVQETTVQPRLIDSEEARHAQW
ncbi:hypothetical protein L226DRAFT_165373 [Lentinus tigrinus ALCF2SS1-7]|uniref:uncharacterized protein n=1 Tax=Lentinus tigrinus ALCF2SS1-7 TaxID=1328758 RepID=UPI001165DB89|nr:hypothetical protein L226DRAFT_165373 [Lentinus tigrinus ALCF2SS1-7]